MQPDKEIGKILSGYQQACVLMTANHFGLFDAVRDGPVTSSTVAAQKGLSEKGCVRLLNALVSMSMVNVSPEGYTLSSDWAPFLAKDGEHSMQQWIGLSKELFPVWSRLGEFVQSGEMLQSVMDMLGSDPVKMRGFIDAMHDKALHAPDLIAKEIPLGDYKRLLDVGGGPGTYSLEWVRKHSNLKATVFDIPPVLEVAKDYIGKYGLQNRVDTLGGDFTKDDLPVGYDLILLANVLHMYDADHASALIKKAASVLAPGGRLIIHGFGPDEGATSPLMDVIFSLNIGMLTEGGRAHPVPEMTDWLNQASLKDARHFRIEAVPTGVLTAVNPA